MVIHYKCPSCGADMKFDSASGKLSCGSCGRHDDIESFPKENVLHKFEEGEAIQYHCKNCGADILTDSDTTATTCCFCGAGVVLADRLSGDLAPAFVIPFQINKDEAKEAFKKWCKKGKLTPKGFMTADRIKNITGMYVPFWLYDLNSKGDVDAVCTKVRRYTRGDYIYTETRYFDVSRSVDLQYVKVPVDASEKMDDELMDKLEPYNYSNLKEFNTPYLAGYIAEKYNYDDKELLPRVQARVENYVDTYIKSTTSAYHTTTIKRKRLDTKQNQAYYTLIPVWMVYYDYGNKEHIFAMNGQTGKVVGKPPISFGKVTAWFSGIAASTFIVLRTLAWLMGGDV
ncbi:TFIIB-type zinc ribbon-containing protein [Halalkalibacter sp. APA_J-10(15)]|uniref:TFIIB-type zinc ribbon-containing protein n=1 Tax=unclassified Halalkalibacter TaxID=2893063 RepID=UPI001FF3B318|nr:TFIIB-type zinc ribbon-containing protein [Halalkalibacter sp. APA_J-10(15)]MCK0472284.1 TFIIB-type zinc ribbon-containing protein [Halalkalibacter sp. APA_J-10(15)]